MKMNQNIIQSIVVTMVGMFFATIYWVVLDIQASKYRPAQQCNLADVTEDLSQTSDGKIDFWAQDNPIRQDSERECGGNNP